MTSLLCRHNYIVNDVTNPYVVTTTLSMTSLTPMRRHYLPPSLNPLLLRHYPYYDVTYLYYDVTYLYYDDLYLYYDDLYLYYDHMYLYYDDLYLYSDVTPLL